VATEVYPRVVPTVAVVGSCKKTKGRVLSHLTRRRNKREKTSSTKNVTRGVALLERREREIMEKWKSTEKEAVRGKRMRRKWKSWACAGGRSDAVRAWLREVCSEEIIERICNQSGHCERHKDVLWNQECRKMFHIASR
jgi:hypothetical protein